jgi:hypothetical protein
MPITFPSNPLTGNVYIAGGKTWIYNGRGWVVQANITATSGGASITVSNSAPTSPSSGALWFNSESGDVGVYFGNGWVAVGGGGSGGGGGSTPVYDVVATSTGYFDLPSGNTAQRPVSPPTGALRYNSTTGFAEVYTAAGWGTFGAQPPSISSVSPATYNGAAGTIFTINGANFTADATVKFIDNANTEYSAATVVFVNSSTLTATTPQNFTVAQEPFDVKVSQSSGQVTLLDCIDAGSTPSWVTAAGALNPLYDAERGNKTYTLSATDPDANTTVVYSVISGSIPAGMTFANTGILSGNANAVVSDTTSSFTVRAADGAGNYSDRSFSLQVKAPVRTTFTYTGANQTYNIPAGITKLRVKLWGGGGGDYPSTSFGGGGGAYASAVVDVTGLTSLLVVVGMGGESVGANTSGYGSAGYGGGGGTGNVGYAGRGGGLAGLFNGTYTQANAIIIAAGGGGGGPAGAGGGGGYPNGADGSATNNGFGGTQTAGGAGGYYGAADPYRGTALTGGSAAGGGDSGGGGGGGGGYWGGGAGFNGDTPSGNSGAGGGSSYIGSNRLTEIVTANASGRTAGNSTDSDRGSYATGGQAGTAGTAGIVIIGY